MQVTIAASSVALVQDAVDGKEEGGQGLAAACGRAHQGVMPRRDHLPAALLDLGGRVECTAEPGASGRGEEVERRSCAASYGGRCGAATSLHPPILVWVRSLDVEGFGPLERAPVHAGVIGPRRRLTR